MEFSSPNIKKILIFSQKRIFLYFVKWNFLAQRLKITKFLYFTTPISKCFLKKNFLYFF